MLRGRIVKTADTDSSIRIKTADGRIYSYALNEVKEIGETPWKERRLYPFDRSRGIFIRPELGLGYSGSIGGSIVLSTGIQFGPHYALYCGWGTGLIIANRGYDRSHQIYIGNLFHFNNNKNCMFMDIRGGAGLNVRNIYHGDTYYSELGSVSLGIGKSLGKYDVGIYGSVILHEPTTIMTYKDDLVFSISIAYNLRKPI